MIYAKNGLIIDNKNKKVFRLYNGKVINKDKRKINTFEFDQIDFNLAEYSSSSIVVPKIQEVNSRVLISCSNLFKYLNDWTFLEFEEFRCKDSIMKDINQEIFKRFFQPLYIPIITIISCFLIIFPKNTYKYERNKKIIFLLNILILIISETSLRYSAASSLATTLYLILPLLFFIIFYSIFYRRVKNMLKTYEKYLIKNFINKFILISLIFFSLILVLSALEEISFLKILM